MGDKFLETLYALYENYKEQKEHALCVFAFMIEAYGIMEDLVQSSF